jgi:hypothetical protein
MTVPGRGEGVRVGSRVAVKVGEELGEGVQVGGRKISGVFVAVGAPRVGGSVGGG